MSRPIRGLLGLVLLLWGAPSLAAPAEGLPDRVAGIRAGLEASAPAVETLGEARERLQLARAALLEAQGEAAWLDPFSERARSIEWEDPAELLREAAAALGTIEGELRGLERARSRTRAVAERRDGEALERLLADPEFADVTKGAVEPGALERLGIWLRAQIFDRLGSATATYAAEVMGWVVRVGMVALGGITLWWLVRRLRTLLREGAAEVSSPTGESTGDAGLSTQERRAELIAGGRFREALRLVHRETLAELARRGESSGARGRTHWEELARLEAAGNPAPRIEAFARINREFDRVWYRGEEVDGPRYERFDADARRWLEAAGAADEGGEAGT